MTTATLAFAAGSRAGPASRRLAFQHTHTGESLDIVYFDAGAYLPQSLAQIDHLCRDFRTGEVHRIDPALLDLLVEVRTAVLAPATGATPAPGCFEIISAFRSKTTNTMLAQERGGVSDRSLHLEGQAIDVRLQGVATTRLHAAALQCARGGVGYYPESDFVHLDTGRVRHW